jgi:hypothetical protein
MTEEQYRADPCPEPSLNATLAKGIINSSPLHASYNLSSRTELTDSLRKGTAFHAYSTGKYIEKLAVFDGKSWAGKDASMFWDLAISNGFTPLLQKEAATAQAMAKAVRDYLKKHGLSNLLEEGDKELCGFAIVGGKWVRCRFDVIHRGDVVRIIELKSCASVKPNDINRQIYDLAYDVAAELYQKIAYALSEGCHRVEYDMIFVENTAPYDVVPVSLSGEWSCISASRFFRAFETWKTCIETGNWPGYAPEGFIRLCPEKWILNKEISE